MKKFSILSIVMLGLFASCKKSSSTPSYSMTATISGTAKSFNFIAPVAQLDSSSGSTYIVITGVLNPTTGESMIIQMDNGNGGANFAAGGKYSDTSSLYDISATYTQDANDIYSAGSVVWGFASAASIPITNHFLITITSINKTAIQGTFSGDFFLNEDASAAKKTVTNGAFNAQFR